MNVFQAFHPVFAALQSLIPVLIIAFAGLVYITLKQ